MEQIVAAARPLDESIDAVLEPLCFYSSCVWITFSWQICAPEWNSKFVLLGDHFPESAFPQFGIKTNDAQLFEWLRRRVYAWFL